MQPYWPQKHAAPGPLVVVGPRQRIVSPLARDCVGPDRALVRARRCPAPTPVPRMTPNTTFGARAGAVGRLRQRKAIGVVGDANLAPKTALEIGLDRLAIQADRVRSAQQAGRARDRARRADADAAARHRAASSASATRSAIAEHRADSRRAAWDAATQHFAPVGARARRSRSWCRPGRCRSESWSRRLVRMPRGLPLLTRRRGIADYCRIIQDRFPEEIMYFAARFWRTRSLLALPAAAQQQSTSSARWPPSGATWPPPSSRRRPASRSR